MHHPEHADDDEKSLMTARINHEHSEREVLEHERLGLLKKKQALIAENKKRKDDLASLDGDLEKFIDVIQPCLFPSFIAITDKGRPQNRFRQFSRRSISSQKKHLRTSAEESSFQSNLVFSLLLSSVLVGRLRKDFNIPHSWHV